jgi:hypothetical protein
VPELTEGCYAGEFVGAKGVWTFSPVMHTLPPLAAHRAKRGAGEKGVRKKVSGTISRVGKGVWDLFGGKGVWNLFSERIKGRKRCLEPFRRADQGEIQQAALQHRSAVGQPVAPSSALASCAARSGVARADSGPRLSRRSRCRTRFLARPDSFRTLSWWNRTAIGHQSGRFSDNNPGHLRSYLRKGRP